MPIEQKIAGCLPFLIKAKLVTEPLEEAVSTRLHRVVEAMGDRLKLFSDILLYVAPNEIQGRLRFLSADYALIGFHFYDVYCFIVATFILIFFYH